MYIIFLVVFFLLFISFFPFRMFILHPFLSFKYSIFDTYFYFKYKKFYIPDHPFINIYVGLFGQGKTLTAVHDVVNFYNTYNDRIVWDDRFHKFVIQKVLVLSNVDLKTIPYTPFVSLQQLQDISKFRHIVDQEKDQRTVTIVLGDEFSVQLNSRSFKTFPVPFIRTLLTSRHCLIHGFYLTSQRFQHVDALLRQVTSNVIECKKSWRFCKKTYYDAWEYENASRKDQISVIKTEGWFCSDKDFQAYDTLSVVQELNKIIDQKDFRDDQSIKEAIAGNAVINISDGTKRKRRKL